MSFGSNLVTPMNFCTALALGLPESRRGREVLVVSIGFHGEQNQTTPKTRAGPKGVSKKGVSMKRPNILNFRAVHTEKCPEIALTMDAACLETLLSGLKKTGPLRFPLLKSVVWTGSWSVLAFLGGRSPAKIWQSMQGTVQKLQKSKVAF